MLNNKTGKKIIILTVLVFIFFPVFVQAVSFWPLVPCGTSVNPTPCNQCDLFRLLKNIIDFVLIGLMPPAAAILFVWGGFLILMGGANPSLISQGKSIFWNTAIGVAIISSSWLITNTIIRSVAADNIAPEWWKFECRVTTPAQQPPPAPQPPAPQPPAPQPPAPSNLCSQPAQLATSNNVPYPSDYPSTKGVNAPELDQLISCVNSKIGGLIDQSQIFTYERTNSLCNFTRGQQTCGSCAHSAFSCHYGGSDGTQGSLAVDFNAKNGNEITLFNELKKLESTCQFGYILFENTHTHISTKSCSGN